MKVLDHRRRLSGILGIIFALMMVVPAAAVQTDEGRAAEARYIGITRLWAGLEINSHGYSTCTGECDVRSGYDVEATMELQQKKDGLWETIKTWSSSGDGVVFIENWYVASGYDYRVKISADVSNADGKIMEREVTYSSVEDY